MKNCGNMRFGVDHDTRGYTELITSRDISQGEEVTVPYDFGSMSGRGKARHGEDAGTPGCRICLEELSCKEACSKTFTGGCVDCVVNLR